jgi:hypothetical protein
MRHIAATRGGRAFIGCLLAATVVVTPLAASVTLAEQVNVFEGTYLSGSTTSYAYGTSRGTLGVWDNRISSLKTTTVVGHGFVFWTGANHTDASWKVCGPATWNTLPSGFNDTISSYNSTSSCPQ